MSTKFAVVAFGRHPTGSGVCFWRSHQLLESPDELNVPECKAQVFGPKMLQLGSKLIGRLPNGPSGIWTPSVVPVEANAPDVPRLAVACWWDSHELAVQVFADIVSLKHAVEQVTGNEITEAELPQMINGVIVDRDEGLRVACFVIAWIGDAPTCHMIGDPGDPDLLPPLKTLSDEDVAKLLGPDGKPLFVPDTPGGEVAP